MVPIHDTDVAEERWSKAEWENFELWERVELRLKRKKRFWILVTLFGFLILSAVPVVVDSWPKWTARSISRRLAQEINRVKRDASIEKVAYRIRFQGPGKLDFVVDRVSDCQVSTGQTVRTGSLVSVDAQDSHVWLTPAQGMALGAMGFANEFCYDSMKGSGAVLNGDGLVGLGIIPVKDLTEGRLDRLSVLLLTGPSAEISFD